MAICSGRIQWLFGEGHAGLAESSALCTHTHPVPPAPGGVSTSGDFVWGAGTVPSVLAAGGFTVLEHLATKGPPGTGPNMGSHPRAAPNGVELDALI